jgi:ferritin-like metal-binding protein YciE
MDNELRREFRAYKAETDDRIARLEAALKAVTDEQKPVGGSKKASGSDSPNAE